MKRALAGILISGTVFATAVVSVCAAGRGVGRRFYDADGNGVCDNAAVCYESCLSGSGCGQYYIDADDDGICDNYTNGHHSGRGRSTRSGCGSGQGHRSGHHHR